MAAATGVGRRRGFPFYYGDFDPASAWFAVIHTSHTETRLSDLPSSYISYIEENWQLGGNRGLSSFKVRVFQQQKTMQAKICVMIASALYFELEVSTIESFCRWADFRQTKGFATSPLNPSLCHVHCYMTFFTPTVFTAVKANFAAVAELYNCCSAAALILRWIRISPLLCSLLRRIVISLCPPTIRFCNWRNNNNSSCYSSMTLGFERSINRSESDICRWTMKRLGFNRNCSSGQKTLTIFKSAVVFVIDPIFLIPCQNMEPIPSYLRLLHSKPLLFPNSIRFKVFDFVFHLYSWLLPVINLRCDQTSVKQGQWAHGIPKKLLLQLLLPRRFLVGLSFNCILSRFLIFFLGYRSSSMFSSFAFLALQRKFTTIFSPNSFIFLPDAHVDTGLIYGSRSLSFRLNSNPFGTLGNSRPKCNSLISTFDKAQRWIFGFRCGGGIIFVLLSSQPQPPPQKFSNFLLSYNATTLSPTQKVL